MTFAEALRKMRGQLNMTQEALARELNVSYATVNKWESNRTKPLRIIRDRLAEFGETNNISAEIINALKKS